MFCRNYLQFNRQFWYFVLFCRSALLCRFNIPRDLLLQRLATRQSKIIIFKTHASLYPIRRQSLLPCCRLCHTWSTLPTTASELYISLFCCRAYEHECAVVDTNKRIRYPRTGNEQVSTIWLASDWVGLCRATEGCTHRLCLRCCHWLQGCAEWLIELWFYVPLDTK